MILHVTCTRISIALFVYLCFCSSVAKIFPSYIRCLESNDHSVVMATMKSVPELVLLCRGKRLYGVSSTFSLYYMYAVNGGQILKLKRFTMEN